VGSWVLWLADSGGRRQGALGTCRGARFGYDDERGLL